MRCFCSYHSNKKTKLDSAVSSTSNAVYSYCNISLPANRNTKQAQKQKLKPQLEVFLMKLNIRLKIYGRVRDNIYKVQDEIDNKSFNTFADLGTDIHALYEIFVDGMITESSELAEKCSGKTYKIRY